MFANEHSDSLWDFLNPAPPAALSSPCLQPTIKTEQVQQQQLLFNTTPAGSGSSATATTSSDLPSFFFLHPSAMLMNEFAFPFTSGFEQLQAAQNQLMIAARQLQQQQQQLLQQQQTQELFQFLDAAGCGMPSMADISPLNHNHHHNHHITHHDLSSPPSQHRTPSASTVTSTPPPISPSCTVTARHSPAMSPSPITVTEMQSPPPAHESSLSSSSTSPNKQLAPKVHTCINCQTSVTPMWRRDLSGNRVCNACGVYFRMNGVHRVVKVGGTAVQRRRARVKDPNAVQVKKRKRSSPGAGAAAVVVAVSHAQDVDSDSDADFA
ncbi:hypothetical protein BDR26DRAFT_859694 [Obelidium mucronatum]|nr:hypothetical protein BDR26DRAFT_859694 [Obelidium mucronatum]